MTFPTRKVSLPRRTAAFALMRVGTRFTGLGDAVLRPQPVRLLGQDEAAGTEALVRRIVSVGPELRVHLELGDGRELWGQVDAVRAELLELRVGQILAFELPGAAPAPALSRAA